MPSYDDAEDEGVGMVSGRQNYPARGGPKWALPLATASLAALVAIAIMQAMILGQGPPPAGHPRVDFCAAPAPPPSLAELAPKRSPPPVLFVDCTIWTGAAAGTLTGASLLVGGRAANC